MSTGARPSDIGAVPTETWRAIVIESPELIVICDENLVCQFASDSIEPITGYSPDQVRGGDLRVLIHRDDLGRATTLLAQMRVVEPSARQQPDIDLRVLFADGRWHDVNVRPRWLQAGHDSWVMLTARDVTEDRRNEAALRRKVQLESLLEQVQHRFINVASSDIDTTVTWALRELGEFLDADRSYVLSYDLLFRTESMSHEWHRAGIESDLGGYQMVSFDVFPAAIERNLRGEISAIADVSELTGEWAGDRQYFEAEGLRSLLELPIVINGAVWGNLGLDWLNDLATWTEDDLIVLGMFASTLGQLFARQYNERRLAETLDQLRMGFESSPIPLALIDIEGRMLQTNDELCALVGRTSANLVGEMALTLVREDFHKACISWGNETLSRDGVDVQMFPAVLASSAGREIWAEITARPVRDRHGTILNFIIEFNDVSASRLARDELDQSEARFSALVDNLPDPVMRVDRDGRSLFSNLAARQLLIPHDEGHYVVTPETRALLRNARETAFDTTTIQTVEYELSTRAGKRYLETRIVPEPTSDGITRSLLLVSTDLTERRRSEAEMAYRASHDELTDLPNRHLFLSHLHIALDRLERGNDNVLAVVFFDLDRFKVVNDSLGHAAGDELLRSVSQRLRATVRPDDVVARLGGDEFTVLLTTCRTVTQVVNAAVRLQQALSRPLSVGGRELIITSSAGIAIATTGKEAPEELMQWADAAMYRAKDEGRDRVALFDDELAADVLRRLELDQRLRHAVDHHEFEVYYQPEVDLATGEVLGVEALLRWNTDGGVLSAAEFIEMAEETGVIVPIGWWVLEQACAEAAKFPITTRCPDGIVVRVNLSARQIDQPDLVARVSEALWRSGLPATRLCLEITETALMANAAASRELLMELDELGVELAVDDFGTGYSSLSYLKQFPVDVLKIDKQFVDGLPDDSNDTAIVTTIVRLADSLGMTVTAEGIEDPRQAERLVELGCTRGQGFHFARPMPLTDLHEFLSPTVTPSELS